MPTGEELEKEIADLAAHLDAATHRLLECIRLFDEAGEWFAQGAVSCAHWLSWRIGVDLGTARERVRVARALGRLPAIDDALRVGPDSNMPTWDGTPPDYDWAVGALVKAD